MFISPNKSTIMNVGFNQYSVKLEPLECGFGNTLGIVFRRVFLSLLSGYAITHVRFTKVLNEFTGTKGIKEDIVDVLNNLKKVRFILIRCSELTITITKTGVTHITAGDFLISSNIIIFNPTQLIATITDTITLTLEIKINKGYGYCFRNFGKTNFEEMGSNWIGINSSYSPIVSLFYKVESLYLKGILYDSLHMFFTTNGTVDPKKCFYEASYILLKQLPFFSTFKDIGLFSLVRSNLDNFEDKGINDSSSDNMIFLKRVDELELSARSLNCLKLEKIFFIKDLIKKSDDELLNIVNFGKKSLLEVKDALEIFGLKLASNSTNFTENVEFKDET